MKLKLLITLSSPCRHRLRRFRRLNGWALLFEGKVHNAKWISNGAMTKAKLNTDSFCKLPLASHIQYMRACASVNKQISECVVSIINKQVSGYVGDIYTYIIHQHMNQHVSVFTRIPCPPHPPRRMDSPWDLPKINAQINCQSLQRNQQANILRIFCLAFCQLVQLLSISFAH